MMASETPNLSSDEIKRRIAAFYTAHAEHYTLWTQTTDFNKLHYLEKVLAVLRQRSAPLKVLELGCGAGVPCTQILAAEKGVELTAVDIAEGQLEIARKEVKGENVKIVLSDMMALEFDTESLDAVVAFYSIMHLPRDEQVILIGRISKWLKPGGVFLVTLNPTSNEGGASENWLGRKETGWMYWSSHDRDTSVKAIVDAGLKVILDEVKDSPEVNEVDGVETVKNIPHLWIMAEKAA